MNQLSVIIITYNEEKNIERCLQSVQPIADEIIVVDSYSTDNTKRICEQYKVKFIEHAFEGYIEQKNFALQQGSCEFALSLDADEAPDAELLQAIISEKQKGFTADVYGMNRCNYFCGKWIKHGAWYPDRKIRLIKKGKGYWGGTNPHDKIIPAANTAVKKLNGDILHYTYHSLEELIAQQNKFSTIAAQAMYQQGKQPSYFKLVLSPLVAFISSYIIKAGFLDKYEGYVIARTMAYYTLFKYAKLIQLHRDAKKK
ncbi:MAG TPA: glycosyltransferase family 2 protein [Chitinophagaceae bacterium]|nr:glycosyltransferase family 2 protein [Chitinophagaceae bacterium]